MGTELSTAIDVEIVGGVSMTINVSTVRNASKMTIKEQ